MSTEKSTSQANGETLPKANPSGARAGAEAKMVKKTQKVFRQKRSDGLYPCNKFDTKGWCEFADLCKFSHLGKDDPGLAPGVKITRQKRKRNGICLKFSKSGQCEFGANCRYRHSQDGETSKAASDALLIATALGSWNRHLGTGFDLFFKSLSRVTAHELLLVLQSFLQLQVIKRTHKKKS